MARRQFRSPHQIFPILPPPRVRRFLSRHQVLLLIFTGLVILSGMLGGASLLILRSSAASPAVLPSATSNVTFQQFLKQGQQDLASRTPLVPAGATNKGPAPKQNTNYANLLPSAEPPTMKPMTQALSSSFLSGDASAVPLDLVGSDGRLELQVQPGALDVTQATVTGGTAPSGALSVQMTQLQGHSIGEMNALGSYQLQVVDSQGQALSGVRLTHPIIIRYHYQPSEMDTLNLDPDKIVLTWPTLIAAAMQANQPTSGFQLAMQNDPATQTLTAQSATLGPGPFDMMGEPQNQSTPALHLASVQGNSGQVTYSYPLQVPPGPGGFAPQLLLNYSSSAPNERHTATSPAGDEGDGWSLNLGSISEETYGSPGTVWYFINNIAGVGDRLIATGSNNLFDTQHISYLRIQQINPGTTSTCFHVWDKSGTYYELGCTSDSLQYWTDSTGQHNYRWDVDKIIAPNEGPNASAYRLIQISYLQDTSTSGSYTSIRDAAIKQITYGIGSTSGITNLAGTVDFHYLAPVANGSWADAYGTDYNCQSTPPAPTTMRCDDPVADGTVQPPTVMSTLTLETVTSYVGSDTGNLDYRYTFSYTYQTFADRPFSTCYDPLSLAQNTARASIC
jgi:hypothetical protein